MESSLGSCCSCAHDFNLVYVFICFYFNMYNVHDSKRVLSYILVISETILVITCKENYISKPTSVAALTTCGGKVFLILMVVGKNEYLYASIFVRGCRYLIECPLVMLFVSISSPPVCCISTILLIILYSKTA